jgi:hypothetical protein
LAVKHTIAVKSRLGRQISTTTLFTWKNQAAKKMQTVQKNHLLGFVNVNKSLRISHFIEKMTVNNL